MAASTGKRAAFDFAKPSPKKGKRVDDDSILKNWLFRVHDDPDKTNLFFDPGSVESAQMIKDHFNDRITSSDGNHPFIYNMEMTLDGSKAKVSVFSEFQVATARTWVSDLYTEKPLGQLRNPDLMPATNVKIDQYNDERVIVSTNAHLLYKYLCGVRYLGGNKQNDGSVEFRVFGEDTAEYWIESIQAVCAMKGLTTTVETHAYSTLPDPPTLSLSTHLPSAQVKIYDDEIFDKICRDEPDEYDAMVEEAEEHEMMLAQDTARGALGYALMPRAPRQTWPCPCHVASACSAWVPARAMACDACSAWLDDEYETGDGVRYVW